MGPTPGVRFKEVSVLYGVCYERVDCMPRERGVNGAVGFDRKITRLKNRIHQSCTSSLHSLLHELDGMTDSQEFCYRIDFDWF